MKVTLEIPDEIADELSLRMGNPAQAAIEALASRAYEMGVFSLEQVRLLLGKESRWDAQQVLTVNGVWPGATVDDFESDMEVLERRRLSRWHGLRGGHPFFLSMKNAAEPLQWLLG